MSRYFELFPSLFHYSLFFLGSSPFLGHGFSDEMHVTINNGKWVHRLNEHEVYISTFLRAVGQRELQCKENL